MNPRKVCIQSSPTFRKYMPNYHGTSFHNDYLYGHGINTRTVWVPLFGLNSLNSIYFLKKSFTNNFSEKELGLGYTKKLENELIKKSNVLLLKKDELIIFDSKTIHGSPKNLSNKTRYSLDFRISYYQDKTSSKKLYNYLFFINNKWKKKNIFEGKKFLKYVCGGLNKDTHCQHLIIEEISKIYGINIVGQEAEIERFGFEILKKIANNKMSKRQYNSIIIASESILHSKILKIIKKSKLKIYAALEGKFLN